MADPTPLITDPDATPEPARPVTGPRAFDADADADERAELTRQRLEATLRSAERATELLDSPIARANAAVTAASLARRQRSELDAEATLRGVPTDPDVRAAVLAADPLPTQALVTLEGVLARREARRGGACLLVLLGPPGTGKSCAGGRAVARHPRHARFVTAADVPLRNGHSEARAEWDRLRAPDLLVVDEIGREQAPGLVVELVLDRWSQGRATVLSGNLEPDVFRARYRDGALRSRIALQIHRGEPCLVVLAGDDLRTAAP